MIATAGVVCTVLAGAIYAASEAAVDAAYASANTTSTQKTISANSNSPSVVQAALTEQTNV